MKGQWIIKQVYFEDGFPKIIRDLKPKTPYVTPDVAPDDRELMDRAWDYLASYTVGERPNASEVNDLIFALESRLTQPETPYTTLTEREESAGKTTNRESKLPNGKLGETHHE